MWMCFSCFDTYAYRPALICRIWIPYCSMLVMHTVQTPGTRAQAQTKYMNLLCKLLLQAGVSDNG